MSTCATCRHWKPLSEASRKLILEPVHDYGSCAQADEDEYFFPAMFGYPNNLVTRDDFGCILHVVEGATDRSERS